MVLLRVPYGIPHQRSFPSEGDDRGKGTNVEGPNHMCTAALESQSERQGLRSKDRGKGTSCRELTEPFWKPKRP